MIGNHCDEINEYIVLMVKAGLINLDGVNTCFALKTDLNEGSIVLFASALMFVVSGTWILRHSQRILNNRLN